MKHQVLVRVALVKQGHTNLEEYATGYGTGIREAEKAFKLFIIDYLQISL